MKVLGVYVLRKRSHKLQSLRIESVEYSRHCYVCIRNGENNFAKKEK